MVHPNAFTWGKEAGGLVKGQLGLPSERDLASTKQRQSEAQSKRTASVHLAVAPHAQFAVHELCLTIATATHKPRRSPSHLPLLSPPFHSLPLWVCCSRDSMKGTATGEDPPP